MYLKRLELKGFKSFPTKTDIMFKEGVTAIVGPNGSGKSNISDAVRWVLGEQSIKSLRGDKLEDVIFAGTDTKKPMNYCEVSLTIDNSDNNLDIDFSEVTIKRRAYRNGESEFFLNNKGCRLKDIKEILLDSGIGKDGYSIIEQGKVDEILSPNPINRRKVFDEACGISKFRYKKQEAQKNLKNTKENLERIHDIYVEIENQLKPLFNQSKKAIKYLQISGELKSIEVNSYIKEIEAIENELKEVEKHSELLNQQSIEIDNQKAFIENEFNQINKEVEDMDLTISKAIEYINTIKTVMNQKDSQVSIIKERIKNTIADIERNQREISDIKEKLSTDKLYIQQLNEKNKNQEENIINIENQIKYIEGNNTNNKFYIENLNSNIENLKDEIINLLNKKQEYSSRLSTLNANKENINSRTENIDSEIEEFKNIEKDKSINLEKLQANFKEKQECLKYLKIDEENSIKKLKELIEENKNLENNIQKNKYSLNDYSSKLNIYKDMENHYEGFNKGVKEVLKNKNLEGIYGALGQVVIVPQVYEKSIEAALGAYMQNIITKDEHCAKTAINYLKKNNLGRVTFLPINIIKSNKIDLRNVRANTKFIGLASDLISYDEKYRNIIESILGRTVIIDNIDNAIKFAKETGHRFKIVTLDGDILNPGGSLTGGSLRTNGNILSRKRLITEYSAKIDVTKIEINSLISKKEKVSLDILNTRTNLQNVQINIKDIDKEVIVQNSNIQRILDEKKGLQSSLEKLQSEKHGLRTNLEYTIEKTNIVKVQIKKVEDNNYDNRVKIESLGNELKEFNKVYETDKIKFDELNLDLVKYKQIQESLIKDIERITKEDEELDIKFKNIEKLLKSQKLECTKLEEEIVIEENEKVSLDKQLSDNNRSLENKKVSKESLKNKLEGLNKELKSSDRKIMELKESLFKVQGRQERLKTTQDTYIAKLFEKYEITLLQAMEIKDDSIIIDKKILENLKREIKSLGNVNVDSIKEYEEVKERHDFYEEQKKDLEDSIEAIESLIKDLEKNMKAEFEVNFNQINENFKYVYKRLFGGGFGELTIIDKENILESDIEIIAQPPGKKMKNLNLLSGGEKALTAISILFSIILVKPTPFCILDEIEAPLDDANIFRFGEFLKELAKDTQFISVTHRRGTMEAADYIYGITMQEKAISKVISLQLQEANEIIDII
ncbi:MAG: chromosome segregation protein SMC [Peptostreptococcaceae bacterium]